MDLNEVLAKDKKFTAKLEKKGLSVKFENGELVAFVCPWLMEKDPDVLDNVVEALARILIGNNFKTNARSLDGRLSRLGL